MPQAANSKNSALLGPLGLRQESSSFVNPVGLLRNLREWLGAEN